MATQAPHPPLAVRVGFVGYRRVRSALAHFPHKIDHASKRKRYAHSGGNDPQVDNLIVEAVCLKVSRPGRIQIAD